MKPIKTCRLCGKDCSKRQRAKDADGNYYCLKCFERRLEVVRMRRALDSSTDDSGSSFDSMSSTFGINSELVAEAVPKVREEDATQTVPCPGCGLAVVSDAVVCVHCGHDFDAGRQLKLRKRVLSREGPMVWPTVLGLLCAAIGSAGLFVYGRQLLHLLLGESRFNGPSTMLDILAMSGASLMLLLAGLLVLGGLLLWMQFEFGVRLLRFWLWTKLLLFTSLLLVGAVAVLVFTSYTSSLPIVRAFGLTINETTRGSVAANLALIALWQAAWPMVLLFFFESERVKKDIELWDAPAEVTTALYE